MTSSHTPTTAPSAAVAADAALDTQRGETYLQSIDVRAFAELQEAERAYLSLYASSPESLNMLNQRAERIRQLLSDAPDELAYFERNLETIHDWLDDHGFDGAGLCVFACELLDYVQGIALPVAPEDTLRVGAAPYIRPLVELQDEYENFLIVAADNEATRIIQVTSALAETADRVRGDIKNHVRKGGWSQQRYERRRDKELLHYAKEINEVLGDLVRTGKFERIVLLGSEETLAKLQDAFTPDVAERVVGASTADLHAEETTLIKSAYELFFAEEREEEERLWERIQAEYLSDGLAAVEPEEVLEALVMGRAAELLVTRDVELTGTRCAACERVTAAAVERCPHCDDEQVFPVDLVEELVRQAELTSAPVEFSDPIPGLTGVGDVAVLLRY